MNYPITIVAIFSFLVIVGCLLSEIKTQKRIIAVYKKENIALRMQLSLTKSHESTKN